MCTSNTDGREVITSLGNDGWMALADGRYTSSESVEAEMVVGALLNSSL